MKEVLGNGVGVLANGLMVGDPNCMEGTVQTEVLFKVVLNDGVHVGLCVLGILFNSSGRTRLSIFLRLSIILALIEVLLNLNLDV